MCTVVVGHPLDTIKVRLQTSSSGGAGMMDCVRLTLKEEGVRGFYKGMQSPLAGEGFFNAAQFLCYGAAKRLLLENSNSAQPGAVFARGGGGAAGTVPPPGSASNSNFSPRGDLTVGEYFVAGALTGFACTFVETPIDLFKSQLQTQIFRPQPLFRTFPQCCGFIWRAGGVRGCFQGMSATFLRTVPASACYFGVYEAAKGALAGPGQRKDELGPGRLLTAGGCGGVAYWLSSFPADSVKSAMQADEVHRSQRKYAGLVDCATQLYWEGESR